MRDCGAEFRALVLRRQASITLAQRKILMRDIASRITAFVAIMVLILMQALPSALAQTPLPAPQQLDQLLAPIALYPDSLLAQITTAATNPREILDVDNWLASYPRLSDAVLSDAAQQQGFDAAFISLVHFPEVLQMMAENIDDYAAIGDAVLADQAAGLCFCPAPEGPSICFWSVAQYCAAGSRAAAGKGPDLLHHRASQSSGRLCSSV